MVHDSTVHLIYFFLPNISVLVLEVSFQDVSIFPVEMDEGMENQVLM